MEPVLSARIAASLVAWSAARQGATFTQARLVRAGLDDHRDPDARGWIAATAFAALVRALVDGREPAALAREAGREALSHAPLGAFRQLVSALTGPDVAFHHVPHLAPLFVRGATVRSSSTTPGRASVDLDVPASVADCDELVAFTAGLLESLPDRWHARAARCEARRDPDERPDRARLVFDVTWSGEAAPGPPVASVASLDLLVPLLRDRVDGVLFEVSPDGHLAQVDGPGGAPLGLAPEAVGRPLRELDEAWAAGPLAAALVAARRGEPARVDPGTDAADRGAAWSVRLHPLGPGPAAPVLGVVEDAAHAAPHWRSRVRDARLRGLGRLLEAHAKGVREALGAVLGYAELGRHTDDPVRRTHAFEVIAETASRAQHRLEHLLRFGQEETWDPADARLDMDQVLREVVELVDAAGEAIGVRVEAEVGPLPPVRGGRGRWELALTAVLQAAMDSVGPAGGAVAARATAEGETVRVEVVATSADAGWAATAAGGGGLVADSGLQVARNLVEQTGGHVEIGDGDGRAARLVLVCPAVIDPAWAPASGPRADAPDEGADPLPSLEVLVVDDEPVIRTLLLDMIAHEGHVASGARHGGEALNLLMQRHYDVIFCDVLMPVMNGLELLARLEAMDPRPAIVMMTGKASADLEQSLRDRPLSALLAKPFPMRHVVELLDRFQREKAALAAARA